MTTGISLVRENAESMQPPRTLWVPFPLGRPLGKPSDPEFQHDVIAAALALLERTEGPVLEDFPHDVPPVAIEHTAACPVSFAKPILDANDWASQLSNELLLLKPWYDLGRRRRGRTTVGISRSTIDDIVQQFGYWLDHPDAEITDLRWFKLAMEDAKAYYTEAMTAQHGEYAITETQRQLWDQTTLGAGLRAFYERFSQDPRRAGFARIIASREAIENGGGRDVIIHGPGTPVK